MTRPIDHDQLRAIRALTGGTSLYESPIPEDVRRVVLFAHGAAYPDVLYCRERSDLSGVLDLARTFGSARVLSDFEHVGQYFAQLHDDDGEPRTIVRLDRDSYSFLVALIEHLAAPGPEDDQ